MMRYLPVLLAIVLVLVQGFVDGWWSNRWALSEELQTATGRLQEVPRTIGPWDNKSDIPMDPRHRAMGEIDGYLLRRYVHRERKTVVSLLIVCGRAGPISVHTPDVCYQGAGYSLAAQPRRQNLVAAKAHNQFWVADFDKSHAPVPNTLRIFWSWNDGHGWQAVDNPRWTFGRSPALYKLYVVREVLPAEEAASDASVEFLQDLLPVLDQVLFAEKRRS